MSRQTQIVCDACGGVIDLNQPYDSITMQFNVAGVGMGFVSKDFHAEHTPATVEELRQMGLPNWSPTPPTPPPVDPTPEPTLEPTPEPTPDPEPVPDSTPPAGDGTDSSQVVQQTTITTTVETTTNP